MSFIKNTLELFKPNDFKDSIYGWLTNQLAHSKGSYLACVFIFSLVYVFCYLFGYNEQVYWVSYFVATFWVAWETRHLFISKNWKDCLEDLFYELSGVALFHLIFSYMFSIHYFKIIGLSYLIIGVTVFSYYKRSKID